jgi:hypothetical protein
MSVSNFFETLSLNDNNFLITMIFFYVKCISPRQRMGTRSAARHKDMMLGSGWGKAQAKQDG